ncbi:hypothetical protein Pcinc_010805 [Petrolisthes cinctipes]|uniref:Uncharacterized protein n=1 Tax=Petrolisthes cinctipes TaxID=88211 RepID=A0AAE1KV31_PETCI|nr:hypothetical protein Pcinc_010805 [Petrolisthes cinctipes]
MRSEKAERNEEEDVKELVEIATKSGFNRTPNNGYDPVLYNKIAFMSMDDDKDDEEEEDYADSVVFLSIDDDKDYEEEDVYADSFVRDGDSGSESESETEDEGGDDSSSSEEKETHREFFKRTLDNSYRPSVGDMVEDRAGNAPLCLSLCRHAKGCAFDTDNKAKIANAVDFVLVDNADLTNMTIDGKEHAIHIDGSCISSFCLSSTVYEVRAYDIPLTDSWGESLSKTTNFDETAMEEHQVNVQKVVDQVHGWCGSKDAAGESSILVNVASTFCSQAFARPCAKAYLAVTTTASPWPCVLRTPSKSDMTRCTETGDFVSFVVPLPFSYSRGRQPKGRVFDNTHKTWSFFTRNKEEGQIRLYGSVIRSDFGDLDVSPLVYDNKSEQSKPMVIAAQSDFAKLRRMLDMRAKELDSFMNGDFKYTVQNAIKEKPKEELSDKLREYYVAAVLASEKSLKHENFNRQLERKLDNMAFVCASFIPGF